MLQGCQILCCGVAIFRRSSFTKSLSHSFYPVLLPYSLHFNLLKLLQSFSLCQFLFNLFHPHFHSFSHPQSTYRSNQTNLRWEQIENKERGNMKELGKGKKEWRKKCEKFLLKRSNLNSVQVFESRRVFPLNQKCNNYFDTFFNKKL